MRAEQCWTGLGAILAGLAVVTGAFAAHGLDAYVTEKFPVGEMKSVGGVNVPLAAKRLQDFHTGAEYQMYHALGLIAVGVVARKRATISVRLAGWSFLLGIVLFSGSLYLLTLTGKTWWGMVTPFGGVLFLVGWVALAVAALGKPSKELESGASC